MGEQITAGVTSTPEKKDDVVTSTTQKDDVVADSTITPDSIDETDISNAVESAINPEEEVKEEPEEVVEETTEEEKEDVEVPDFTNKKGKEKKYNDTEEYKKFVQRTETKLNEKYEKKYQEKLKLEAEKLAEEKLKEKYPDVAKEKKSIETDYNSIENELEKFAEEETETGAKLIKKVLEISKLKDKQLAELREKQEQLDEKLSLEESAKKAVKEADEQEEYNNFFKEFPDAAKEDSIWAKNYNNTINFVMQQKKVSPLEALHIAVKDKINIGFGAIPETIIGGKPAETVSSKTKKLISGAKQRIEAKPTVADIYNGNEVVSRQEYDDPEEAVASAMDEFSGIFEDEALHQNS